MTVELKPGDLAPEFALSDQDGDTLRLSDFTGRKVLLYFFPEVDTPGCTIQSCAVRDAREELAELDVEAVGISPDPPDAQKRFDEKYGLGFRLLADPDYAVAKAYGAWREKSRYGRTHGDILRSSFLIDEKGRIARAWYKVAPKDTAPHAIEALAG